MITNFWGSDCYWYIIYLLISISLYNFNWNRDGILKYTGNTQKLPNLLQKTKYNIFKGENKTLQNTLTQVILCLFYLIWFLINYWNGYTIIYNMCQINIKNLTWFYLSFLLYLFIILFHSFKNVFQCSNFITDLRYSILFLFIICIFIINLNNLFAVVFLLECQSIFIVYFLLTTHQFTKNTVTNTTSDMYKCLNTHYLSHLNLLFIQFWVIFVAAIVLLFVLLWFSAIVGVACWTDLNYLSFFYIFKIGLGNYFVILIIGLFLLLGLSLKIGIFPFHFWKPDLYKNITLWGMIWYLLIFTFALLFFSITLFNLYLESNLYYWQVLLYILAISGLGFLINIIFIITELKVFIAYTSVFHMIYIILFFICEKSSSIIFSLNYLIIYTSIMLYFFLVLLCIENKEFKFLTDFNIVNQSYLWGCFLLSSVLAMSGIPPFIGFWLKISLIVNLLYMNKLLLVGIVFGTGVCLIYFYVQNYRFVGGGQFTWDYVSVTFRKNSLALYILIIICFIINIMYIFFINDLLNYINLIYFILLLKW